MIAVVAFRAEHVDFRNEEYYESSHKVAEFTDTTQAIDWMAGIMFDDEEEDTTNPNSTVFTVLYQGQLANVNFVEELLHDAAKLVPVKARMREEQKAEDLKTYRALQAKYGWR